VIVNLRHSGIVVDDLERSLRFYEDVLGFGVVKRMEESGPYIEVMTALEKVKVTTVKMALDNGQMVELLKFHSHESRDRRRDLTDRGLSHIAFSVDDLDAMYRELKKKGVVFNGPPQHSPDGFAKIAFLKAPEGTFIELVEECS